MSNGQIKGICPSAGKSHGYQSLHVACDGNGQYPANLIKFCI